MNSDIRLVRGEGGDFSIVERLAVGRLDVVMSMEGFQIDVVEPRRILPIHVNVGGSDRLGPS